MPNEIKIPTGYRIEWYFTPTGRRQSRLVATQDVNWEGVVEYGRNGAVFAYAAELIPVLRASAGAGRSGWPRATGRSISGVRLVETTRWTAADRYYSRDAEPTRGGALIVFSDAYSKTLERGAYYQGGRNRGYRRPKGRYIARLHRRILLSVLNGRSVRDTISRLVTQAWRARIRQHRQLMVR